jgi:hypothetical protein
MKKVRMGTGKVTFKLEYLSLSYLRWLNGISVCNSIWCKVRIISGVAGKVIMRGRTNQNLRCTNVHRRIEPRWRFAS